MSVREDFLSYIWKHQRFKPNSILKSSSGQVIKVFKTGNINHDQGPDFSEAHLEIDDLKWIGMVEIHVKAADWHVHKHTQDPKYNQVILHVVWKNNLEIERPDGSLIPTLELKDYIEDGFLDKFNDIIQQVHPIKCSTFLPSIAAIKKIDLLEKALTHRLHLRSVDYTPLLEKLKYDWEEFSYILLAKYMGFKLNAFAFMALAETLPYAILRKHKDNLSQIEALIFGQAGFLEEEFTDEYSIGLKKEYEYLRSKYNLSKDLNRADWKFSKTRKGNFPTVRLAQFAAIIKTLDNIFQSLIGFKDGKEIRNLFKVTPSDYWKEHYDFSKKSATKLGGLGKTSLETLLMNLVPQLLYIYGQHTDNYSLIEKAFTFLESCKADENHIIDIWKSLGFDIKNGYDSQALLEQYKNFCTQNRCLACVVGSEILKKKV